VIRESGPDEPLPQRERGERTNVSSQMYLNPLFFKKKSIVTALSERKYIKAGRDERTSSPSPRPICAIRSSLSSARRAGGASKARRGQSLRCCRPGRSHLADATKVGHHMGNEVFACQTIQHTALPVLKNSRFLSFRIGQPSIDDS